MKLKELHLTNFRGFEQLDIVFPNRLAVFMGISGAGKSAVLDAICLYFIQLAKGIAGSSRFGEIDYDMSKDIKTGMNKTLAQYRLKYHDVESLSFDINIEKHPFLDFTYSYVDGMDSFYKVINETFNIPILVHYQSSKQDEKKVKRIIDSKRILPQFSVYENAFYHAIKNFSDFITWFKDEEDREKDIIIIEKNFGAKNSRLEFMRHAISNFLQTLNGEVNFSDLKINREANLVDEFKVNSNYHLTIKKAEQLFDLSQLSEGEKTVIMLVGDISRRLITANPRLANPLEGEGIVLIDEIDSHLHPQWQREVIPALLATFPNLQFIVTTHSPQVLSKVKKESIFILEDGKLVKNVPNTYGRNASAILFEIFGVTDRPEEVQAKINRCSQLMEEENYAEAKVLLKELTDLLGENDEAVVGARTQLLFDNQMAEG
jgi:predicted ATP-binding protein involved in virulence